VKSQPINSPDDSTGSKASLAISKILPGPDFLRYYPAHRLIHRLIAWQPQGTLDDLMLDQIADWLVGIEQARKRAELFTGVDPVRTALFSDDWVAFGIARLYESLMQDTLIEVRAFRDLAWAAKWLAIPVGVLTLKDKPAPPDS